MKGGTAIRVGRTYGTARRRDCVFEVDSAFPDASTARFALQLIKRNRMPDCMLRLSISRGITARGYSPKGAVSPAIVMTLHPLPAREGQGMPRWRVITSSIRAP